MDYYCFELKPTLNCDVLWEELSNEGYQLLYSVEEPNTPAKIFGYPPQGSVKLHPGIASASLQNFETIDWKNQWCEAAGGDSDGTLELNLSDYLSCEEKVTVFPGPGFGDLTHPTTKQTLRLMASHLQNKFVLDVGCGSGILSLAAAQLGASKVHGIDIDAAALAHACSNAEKNILKAPVSFGYPWEEFDIQHEEPLLIAMNMIYSEQKTAWEGLKQWHNHPAEIITSGVLVEQREEYLNLCKSWGWELVEETSLEGWKAFYFNNNKPKQA